MRNLMFILTAFAVMGLAFWAYKENYRTQAELSETRQLQGEIADLRESLGVLRAEWAYLNRPDRLRELADINFGRLALLPLEPDQFGEVRTVSYPTAGLLPGAVAVDAVAMTDAGAEAKP